MKKLETIDSSYFRGNNHFEEDGTQNYLVFQPIYKYFKNIGNTANVSEYKSKGVSDKAIKTPDNTLAPELIYSVKRMHVKFNESSLKQDKITFNYGKMVNIYIFYALKSTLNYGENINLENCLFGAVKITTKH